MPRKDLRSRFLRIGAGIAVIAMPLMVLTMEAYADSAATNAAPTVADSAATNAAPTVADSVPTNGAPAAPAAQPPTLPPIEPSPADSTAPPTPGPALTIDQAVQMALNNNPSVQLARLKLQNAEAQYDVTYSAGLPQIRGNILDTQSSGISVSPGGGASSSGVNLPNGGAIPVITDQGAATTGTAGFSSSAGGGATYIPPTATTTTVSQVTPDTAAAPQTTTTTTTASSAIRSQATPAAVANAAVNPDLPPVLNALAAAASQSAGAAAAQPKGGGSGGSSNNFQSVGGYNNYGADITVTQPVDIFGLVPAGLAVSRLTRDFYATDLERTSNEVALTAKEDFINVLSDQDAVATQQEQVDAATESLRIANAEYSVGTIAKYDLLSAEASQSNAQQQLLSAQYTLSLDEASLNNVLGQSQSNTFSVVAPPLPPLNQTFDLNSLIQTAYQKRPEMLQAARNIIIAKKLVFLTGAALYPALTLSGSADSDGPAYPGIKSSSYSVTADLGVPIYDGGETRALVRSAKITVQTQEVTEEQLQQSVALEVRQAYLEILNAQSRSSAAQDGVNEAEEALRIAIVRYQHQLGTLLDLANAEAQAATARNNLTSAQHDYLTALALLVRAEGGR